MFIAFVRVNSIFYIAKQKKTKTKHLKQTSKQAIKQTNKQANIQTNKTS